MKSGVDKQNIGNAGEHYICAFLSAKNFVVTITTGRNIGYDLLAVNPNTKTFFVLDSKNYFLKLSPGDIKNEINHFITKKKSDLIKLEKKENFVRNNTDFFLDYFKISDQQGWNFKKGFIIKYNFPSAYVKNIEADFIFQSDLERYLKV